MRPVRSLVTPAASETLASFGSADAEHDHRGAELVLHAVDDFAQGLEIGAVVQAVGEQPHAGHRGGLARDVGARGAAGELRLELLQFFFQRAVALEHLADFRLEIGAAALHEVGEAREHALLLRDAVERELRR